LDKWYKKVITKKEYNDISKNLERQKHLQNHHRNDLPPLQKSSIIKKKSSSEDYTTIKKKRIEKM
jgi:hypothetical protein